MPGGRPTLLDDRTANRIIAAVQTGTPVNTATRYAGIEESTLYKWRKRADAAALLPIRRQSAAQRRLVEFFQSLDAATAECAVRMQAVFSRPLPQARYFVTPTARSSTSRRSRSVR